MIYQCYGCRKLFDEDDGAMIIAKELSSIFPPTVFPIMAFKCKKCIGEKGIEMLEKIQNKEKNDKK